MRAEVGCAVKGLNCGLKGELSISTLTQEIAEIGYTRFFKTCSGETLLAIPYPKIVTWVQASHWGKEVVWRGKSTARPVSFADIL